MSALEATSVEGATGARPDVEAVLAALLGSFARRYAELHAPGGASQITRDWSANSSYAAGRRVRVHTATRTFDGTTRGLAPDGALRVETATGEIETVRAGDVYALRAETMKDEVGTMNDE